MHLFVVCWLYIWVHYLFSMYYYLKHGISGLPVKYSFQVFCKPPVKLIQFAKSCKDCSKEKKKEKTPLSLLFLLSEAMLFSLTQDKKSTMHLSVTHHLILMNLVCTGKTKGTWMKGRLLMCTGLHVPFSNGLDVHGKETRNQKK